MGFHFVCGVIIFVPELKIALKAAKLFSLSIVLVDTTEEMVVVC